jgi:Ca-activated chloride channel homolog
MQLLWPVSLWFLLIVPVLLGAYIWIQRRRRRYALRYSSLSLVKEATVPGSQYRRHIPPGLFLLGLTVMLFALARPQTVVLLPAEQQTVILAIDVSGSMRSRDINPNRIEAAKVAAVSFVQQQRPATRVGIVAFSGTASIVQPPTTDHDAAISAIKQLTLERSTAIGSGILVSLNAIYGNLYTDTFGGDIATAPGVASPTPVPQGMHVPATVILLTDGANVQGPSPIEAAQKAADLGVRVFTIGVGDPNASFGGPPPGGGSQGGGGGRFFGGSGGRFEVDESTLKNIAETTDGEFFLATDAGALKDIYQKLNTEIVFTTQKTEVTALFTAGGMILSIVALGLSMLWFNRIL